MVKVKSTSSEGVYYLVNGWAKNKKFWVRESYRKCTEFKTLASAKRSLTMLLKIMPDYADDIIEFETY